MSLALRALFFTCLVSIFCEHSQAQTITIAAAGYGSGTTSFNYYPSTQTFNFSGSFFGYSGNGSSSYSINSANSITIAGFYLYTYETLTVPAFSMTRSGSSYNGSFYSSLLGTTVYVSVSDPYDSDSDGIPDLSDNVFSSPPVAPSALINGIRSNLGQFFTYSPLFENSPTSYSATDLPPGISVNSNSGTISGTPTAAGYYYGLLTAYNSSGSASLDIPITIPGTLQSIPFSDDFSVAVSNRYMPVIFSPLASMSVNNGVLSYTRSSSDDEGATVAWVLNLPLSLSTSWQISTDVTMPSGWSTPFAGVGLTLQPYLSNGTLESVMANRFNFSLGRDTQDQSVNGNYLFLTTYSGDIETSDQRLNTPSTSLSLRLVYDSTQKTISASYRTSSAASWISVGSPQNFNPSSASSLAQAWGLTSSSSLQMALYANSYSANGTSGKVITLDNLSITAFTPPTITSPLTSSGTVAGSFSYQTTATGNPTTFNLSGTLPTGLTFNSSTGRITGIPTQSGTFTVSLSATSGSYTGPSVSLRITIPALVGSYTSGYAASSQYSADSTAAKAFDNNANTMWFSAKSGAFPHILARDFGSPVTIASISLNNGHLDGQYFATSLQVLGSNDNLVWTTLGTFSSLVSGSNTLSLSSPQTYRYFALRATAGSHPSYWGVREIIFVTNYASFIVPSAPRNLGAVAGTKIATLTWDPPTSNGGFAISGYRIEISTDNGTSYRYFATSTGSGTTFTATGLTSGQNYKFRVAAQSFLGTGSYNLENYGTPSDFSTTREALLDSTGVYSFFVTGIQFQSLTKCFLFFNAPSDIIWLPNLTNVYLNREIFASIVHGPELINQPFALARTISSQKYYLRFTGSFGDRQEIYSSSVAPL